MRWYEIMTEDAEVSQSRLMAWFRGSQVVDDQGQPKRMYHGTGSGDIASFSLEKANAEALYGPGFYFTDNPTVAGGTGDGRDESDIYIKADWQLAGYAWQGRKYDINEPLTKKQMTYAKRLFGTRHVEAECREDIGMRRGWQTAWRAFEAGEEAFRQYLAGRDANPWLIAKLKIYKDLVTRPTVFPVYLRITHPFNMDAVADISLLRTLWDATQIEHHESFENASSGWKGSSAYLTGDKAYEWLVKRVLGGNKTAANEALMQLGYDGIFHTGGFNIGTMGKHAVWIAFRPEQIKSVWSKSFDPRTDQISESPLDD